MNYKIKITKSPRPPRRDVHSGIFPKPGGPDPIPVMKKVGGR